MLLKRETSRKQKVKRWKTMYQAKTNQMKVDVASNA